MNAMTIEDLEADAVHVIPEPMNAFEALGMAERRYCAPFTKNGNGIWGAVLDAGIAISSDDIASSVMFGVEEVIPNFYAIGEALYGAGEFENPTYVGLCALGLTHMMPSRIWIPVLVSDWRKQELHLSGIVGLDIADISAPVVVLPEAHTGEDAHHEFTRLGCSDMKVELRPDLIRAARAELDALSVSEGEEEEWHQY